MRSSGAMKVKKHSFSGLKAEAGKNQRSLAGSGGAESELLTQIAVELQGALDNARRLGDPVLVYFIHMATMQIDDMTKAGAESLRILDRFDAFSPPSAENGTC